MGYASKQTYKFFVPIQLFIKMRDVDRCKQDNNLSITMSKFNTRNRYSLEGDLQYNYLQNNQESVFKYSPVPSDKRSRSVVWNYTHKFTINGAKFVKCNICGQHFQMKNTCTNHIRRHLQKTHQIQLNDQEQKTPQNTMNKPKLLSLTPPSNISKTQIDQLTIDENLLRKNRSEVWAYSQKINLNGKKMAQCMYCGWRFEMKTTCTNQIRRHLQKEHKIPLSVQKTAIQQITQNINPFKVEVSLPENPRARSEVWNYAEKIVINDKNFIKCNYCGQKFEIRNTSTSPIRRHLQDAHKIVFSQKLLEHYKSQSNNDLIIAKLLSVSLLSHRQLVEVQQICKNNKIINIDIPLQQIQISNILKRVFQIKCEHIKQVISSKFGQDVVISIENCTIQSQLFFGISIFDEDKRMYRLPLIRQIPKAQTDWIKDKLIWILQQMGIPPHQIKTMVSFNTASMVKLSQAMGWTHQICLVQMINMVVQAQGQWLAKYQKEYQQYEQEQNVSTVKNIIKQLVPIIIAPQNKCTIDVSMQNVLQVFRMAKQKLQRLGCNIIQAQTFIDTLIVLLLRLNSQMSKRACQELIKQYQVIRNNQLVWAGLYLRSQNLYQQYVVRCKLKKMEIAQIEQFLAENFDQFGEVNFSKFQQAKYDEEIYQEHQNLIDQQPYNSFLQSLKAYRQKGIKNDQLKQVQKKINMIPCRMVGSAQIFKSYAEKLGEESIICISFLNWYFKSFKQED